MVVRIVVVVVVMLLLLLLFLLLDRWHRLQYIKIAIMAATTTAMI